MNRNGARAAKLRLGAALMHAGLMIEAPLSVRYGSKGDLEEIGNQIGADLVASADAVHERLNRSRLLVLPHSTVTKEIPLVELVREFQEFLSTMSRERPKQGVSSDSPTDDDWISYGLGISARRKDEVEPMLAVRLFSSRTAIRNADKIRTQWSDDFTRRLGVDVELVRMGEPSLMAKGGDWYHSKKRPVTIGSAVSSVGRNTSSVTLFVKSERGSGVKGLDEDKRYLLTAGHIVANGVHKGVGSHLHQPSLEHDRGAHAVAKVAIVDAPSAHGMHCEMDICLAESMGIAFSNAWGQDGRLVTQVCSPDDAPIWDKVQKMGGAGTGDVETQIVGVEEDIDLRSADGKKFRYLDQVVFGSDGPISEPGDSGSLISYGGKALAMIVAGGIRRGKDQPYKNVSYATYLDRILDRYKLEIVY